MNTPTQKSAHRLRYVSALVIGTLAMQAQMQGAEIAKANNSTALNLTGSWVGGAVPTSGDTIVFDSTLTTSRSSALGADLSVNGIVVRNPTVGTTQTISNTLSTTLTLGSGGIDMSTDSTAATLVIDNVINFAADQTWSLGTGDSLTLGTNGKTSTGSGNLTISGPGTFYFPSGGSAFSYSFGSGSLTLGNGVTLSNSINPASLAARTITNATTLSGDITLQNLSSGNLAIPILFSGGLDIGSGTRTITFSRPNNINAAGSPSNAVLQVSSAGGITGTGKLVLANASTDTSKSTMLLISAGGSLGVGTLQIGNNVYVGFNATTGDIGTGTDVIIDTGGALALVASGSGTNSVTRTVKSLSGSGLVTNLSTSSTGSFLAINGGTGTGTTIFSGTITSGPTAATHITKTGSTTQIFSGANTYTGQTQVLGGSLYVNGSHIESTTGTGGYGSASNGHYLVASGATLGGSGRIAGNSSSNTSNMILVQSGGTLAPGGDSGIGTFVLDGVNITGASGARVLNMASGAKFDFTLAGNGTSADTLAFWNYVSGDLLLNSNAINLSLTGPQASGTYTVSLFTFYSDSGTSVASSGITSGLSIGTLDSSITSASIAYNSGGSTIDITYTVLAANIPEPSSLAAIFGVSALAGTLLVRRRQCPRSATLS